MQQNRNDNSTYIRLKYNEKLIIAPFNIDIIFKYSLINISFQFLERCIFTMLLRPEVKFFKVNMNIVMNCIGRF